MHRFEVLRRPLITEKYAAQQALGKYTFRVAHEATKAQIKEAVERGFGVTVLSTNLMMVAGKRRRLGRRVLPAKPWKKAIVTLKLGDKIDLFESAA